jgi:hypothetical protein
MPSIDRPEEQGEAAQELLSVVATLSLGTHGTGHLDLKSSRTVSLQFIVNEHRLELPQASDTQYPVANGSRLLARRNQIISIVIQ